MNESKLFDPNEVLPFRANITSPVPMPYSFVDTWWVYGAGVGGGTKSHGWSLRDINNVLPGNKLQVPYPVQVRPTAKGYSVDIWAETDSPRWIGCNFNWKTVRSRLTVEEAFSLAHALMRMG